MNKTKPITLTLLTTTTLMCGSLPLFAQNDNPEWACKKHATENDWVCDTPNNEPVKPNIVPTYIPQPAEPVSTTEQTESEVPEESDVPYWKQHATIVPSRTCRAPYTGLLLGSVDEEAFNAAPLSIQANSSQLTEESQSVFIGDVQVKKLDREVSADVMYYNPVENVVDAEGNVRYTEPGIVLVSDSASVSLADNTVSGKSLEYRIEQAQARGFSSRFERAGDEVLTFEEATYTTCFPGDNAWVFSSEKIVLNPQEGWGKTYGATLRVKDVPVMYVPYYSFPIDDRRKSGFLTPTFGRNDDTGTDISVPYYWNIAPNYDATLTPRYMSRRGYQLQSEFRYLLSKSHGNVNMELLPHDHHEDKTRFLAHVQHTTRFNPHWVTNVNVNYVTDDDYFDDLGDNLSLSNLTHLRKEGDLRYEGEAFTFLTRVQGFQTIDDTITDENKPFNRLPQMILSYRSPTRWLGLDWSMRSEFVYFERANSLEADGALRIDVQPGVTLPLEASFGYIRPSVKYKYTYYDLTKISEDEEEHIERALPILSVDGRLFLERDLHLFKRDYLHTLEPRIFYVFIPNEDQDDIPVFDSTDINLTFGQLFRENRFSGTDRIGDTNQITLGLTTRLFEKPKRKQRLRASLGQIFFFEERDVTIKPSQEVEEDSTPLFFEFDLSIWREWSFRNVTEWDYLEDQTLDRTTFKFYYRGVSPRLFNFGYHFRRGREGRDNDEQSQIEASFALPLFNDTWRLLGKAQYDLNEGQEVETLAGVEYRSCCWATRFVYQRKLDRDNDNSADDEADVDNAFYFQVELTGLAGFGTKSDSLLRKGIPGYDPEFESPLGSLK